VTGAFAQQAKVLDRRFASNREGDDVVQLEEATCRWRRFYVALAYYHANREAIEADSAAEDEAYERLMREHCGNRRHQP